MPSRIIKRIVLALLFVSPVHAQTEHDTLCLTIREVFERASQEHLQLVADRLKEQMAQEQIKTARTERLPELTVGLRGGFLGQPIVWQNGLSNAARPESPDWQQNYALDFTQPIYQGGKIRYTIRKADLQHELAQLQTDADLSEIKLTLLEQYLNLFSLYKQNMVLIRNLEESERRLKDIRRMKEEGIITNNDVLRSEMQLTEDRLAITETQNNIRIVSQQLDLLLGLDEKLLLKPDTVLLEQECPIIHYNDYIELAMQHNPSIRILRKQTELAENEIRLTRSAQLPKLNLTASNTLARPISRTMADLYNNSWNIGLSLTYSLSALYKNPHRIKEAQQNIVLMQNAEAQEQQRIRMNIRTALLKHQEATERVEALKLSVKQAEENYRIMYNRYMNQLAILTDLLDADNLRLNAELKLTTARTQAIYTFYELQKATGNL